MACSRHLEERCQLGETGMSNQRCQRTVTDAPLADVRVTIDPRAETAFESFGCTQRSAPSPMVASLAATTSSASANEPKGTPKVHRC